MKGLGVISRRRRAVLFFIDCALNSRRWALVFMLGVHSVCLFATDALNDDLIDLETLFAVRCVCLVTGGAPLIRLGIAKVVCPFHRSTFDNYQFRRCDSTPL